MMLDEFPSKMLEKAVDEFTKLPGVGRKTALRFVLHLLKLEDDDLTSFGTTVLHLKEAIKYCKICQNISDSDVCEICNNPNRDHQTICVVENIKDVISLEHTRQFRGVYHVLGGVISPMDGIGPGDLKIEKLIERANDEQVKEVILALRTTMEGDTTSFYIYKKLVNIEITLSTLSRGVSIGDELEYIDEITLGRSLINRMPFNPSI